MVRLCLTVALLALAAASPALAEPHEPTKEELYEVVGMLWADGRLWAEDKDVPLDSDVRLKEFWFTPASVSLFAQAVRTLDPNTVGLYVINKLVRRLADANTATVKAALPAVKDVNGRVRKTYLSFPKLSDRAVKALQKPTSNSRVAREALARRRQEKLQRERPIAKHNQMVYVLDKYTCALMLLARDPAEDQQVAERLVLAEKTGSAMWLTILDLLGAEARYMILDEGRKRAEVIYKVLRPHGIELKMEKRKGYVNRGKATLREDDRSSFETVSVYPGIRLLSTLNRLATASKLPALKVPKDKDVVKYHREQEKKRRAATKSRR